MFRGSSPTADRMTPTTIDNSTSLASTASGGPPRKRLITSFAMGLSFFSIVLILLVHFECIATSLDHSWTSALVIAVCSYHLVQRSEKRKSELWRPGIR